MRRIVITALLLGLACAPAAQARKLGSLEFKPCSLSTPMLGKAIEAFTTEDSQLARRVIELDKEIDSIYQKIVRTLMDYMRTEPTTSTRILQLLFVAKHIERIGDYVKDMCELTVYMAEAEFIKHGAENV